MRRVSAVLAVAVVVLAGLAPVAAAAPAAPATADAAVASDGVDAATQVENNSAPPDPETDRLGWEDGYWHNESIAVDQSDGITQDELDATIARAKARVEVIRGVEFDMDVPVEIVPRSEFANSSGNVSYSDAFRRFDNTKFEALFLIGEGEGSLDVQQANRGASVAGYYSPAADAIVLVTDNESSLQVDELTLGHELVHAMQDQEFDLANFTSQTRDGANANSGLIEGDANLVQYRYEERCGEGGAWNGTCLRPDGGDGGGASPPNMGVYFLNYQPYSDGPAFVAEQKRQGGWEQVNELYDAPPESAEQVIHPDRYGTDPPTEVELADEHADGWERVRPERRTDYAEVGQSGVAAMFAYPLYAEEGDVQRYARDVVGPNAWLNYTDSGEVSRFDPLNYGFDAAAGWDGDRMHFYRSDDGETGYVWRLVWDSDAEATEFRGAYESLLAYWGAERVGEDTYRIADGSFADAFHVTVAGDTVTIVNAPSVDSLSEVRESVETEASTPAPTATAAPGEETPTATDATTTTEAPGFSALAALVSVLGAALLFGRR
ncbi:MULTISPECIES: Hvo_1808 family surface protein [Halolamina]|uniref:PGF-CTERM protein n=1 Tax=Halolamina pelagica TaxID=699431 RepID=A0A1I5UDH3_9EURY|nr:MULTISPECIES: Hvo_1808 family surface protein [Halolamina]NHX37237.1 PGF-CTERM sorting domain-containing protein [Halolamina sp. R1-12]SFP93313.1 PGF-CTERM protein [Halolamina pelagica]